MKKWYEIMFEDYGKKYDDESFTHGTKGECDFIEKEVDFNKNRKILDIGCGTGRHSIELAKRGYCITGIDLSDSLLNCARKKALAINLQINFYQHDARKVHFQNEFDLTIMLCEGAFPLMETDEMNFKILKNANRALKKKGKLILTTLNGLYPLFHYEKYFISSTTKNENALYEKNSFDLLTFREFSTITIENDFGIKRKLKCNERYYVPSEVSWLLKSLRFKSIDIYGARLGAFSRENILTTDDLEMLVIAQK